MIRKPSTQGSNDCSTEVHLLHVGASMDSAEVMSVRMVAVSPDRPCGWHEAGLPHVSCLQYTMYVIIFPHPPGTMLYTEEQQL